MIPYTQQDLADDLSTARESMSRVCVINEKKKRPQFKPTLHTLIKVIAVVGMEPRKAYTWLLGFGHNLLNVPGPEIEVYMQIIDNPHPLCRNKAEAVEFTEEINTLLLDAVKKGAVCKGNATINSVFVLFPGK